MKTVELWSVTGKHGRTKAEEEEVYLRGQEQGAFKTCQNKAGKRSKPGSKLQHEDKHETKNSWRFRFCPAQTGDELNCHFLFPCQAFKKPES